MTTYRAIATTETDPQAPITSALMKALEANHKAAMEGDPTATAAGVYLRTAALFRPTAGNVVIARGRDRSASTTTIAEGHDPFRVIVPSGTVRMGWTLTRTVGTGGPGTAYIYRNGSLIHSNSTNGAQTFDFSVSFGDLITYAVSSQASTTYEISNVRIMAATADLAVV